MELHQLRIGQRVRVNVPGIGDHGQVGTVKQVRDLRCYVHLDWDERPHRVALFFAADLDEVPTSGAAGVIRTPGERDQNTPQR
jgi:hypothetical protein